MAANTGQDFAAIMLMAIPAAVTYMVARGPHRLKYALAAPFALRVLYNSGLMP